ncbi:membrane protein [Virgisporangium aliadipatigenens]|uniref:Membrane protein n=1 Tax=Virgisporangium aliadipatigenens TaxID=741659 RepID=A0A8J4DQ78_9ACTN|nr:ABC transporter permease [Virgisporangium aliadipatigenens]GIJ45132.1 membrane protein [Virgisporangium aliadipatigenens]
MFTLGVRLATKRVAATLAVVVAVLGGAAFLTCVGILAESGFRSHAPVDRLAGADVVVSADQTRAAGDPFATPLPERALVPADVVERLRALPGVTSAVGDLSFPAAALTADGTPVTASGDPRVAGHGWSSTVLIGQSTVDGVPPAGQLDVALDRATADAAGVRTGDAVTVVAAGRQASYRVSAIVSGGGIYFADPTARELATRNRPAPAEPAGGPSAGSVEGVDLVVLTAEAGKEDAVADAVRQAVRGTGLVVSTGDDRGDVESPGTTAGRRILPVLAGSLGGVTLLVVGFIVGGALAVSVAAQRRDLALMRAVGATPKQVRGLAAAQASAAAAVAAVPGIALGYPLAGIFRDLLVRAGFLPGVLPLSFSPVPAAVTVLLLAAVIPVAARLAVWRTSRMAATEAVAESRVEPRRASPTRTFAGLLVLVAAHVVAVTPLFVRTPIGASVTAVAGIIATIGLAIAGPGLVAALGRVLHRVLPARASASTWLAVANTHGYPQRVAGAVTTLAMAVVFTLTYALTQTTLLQAARDDVREGTLAELSVTAPAVGGMPAELTSAVRGVPGVRGAAAVTSTTVLWTFDMLGEKETESASAMILNPDAPGVLDLDVRTGDLADLRGATVAVDADTARGRDANVGDTIDLTLGDGTAVKARVVATYGRGFGFGPLVVSRDLAAGHTTTALDQQVLVRTDGAPATLAALEKLAAAHPGMLVGAPPAPEAKIPPELWINAAVLLVLLGYLLFGIANRLVATTTRRRTELAALQLAGATPAQVRRTVRQEALLVCATAIGAGAVLSAGPLVLLAVGILGRPVPAGPWWSAPLVFAIVALIALLSMELPTRRALAVAPVEALTRD